VAPSEKLWGGRFSRGADPAAERFTGSLAFDRRLWPHDVRGSVAWAKALAGRRGYLPRRVPLGVRFGPARCYAQDRAGGGRSARLHVTRRIMDDIAALLP